VTRWHLPVALAAFGFAACGGDSDQKFRERAQTVCTSYAAKIQAIERPRDLTHLAETSGQTADLLEQQLAELRGLEAPGAVATDFGQWLKLTGEAVSNARAIQTAAKGQDQQRVLELAGEAAKNTLSADRIARDLKLSKCMIEAA